MKTGRDVVVGAILGATSSASPPRRWWSRLHHDAQVPLEHLPSVATQTRSCAASSSKPEHVVNYFFFVAEEVRELMAQLGIRHLSN